MPGNPTSPYPTSQQPYVRMYSNGVPVNKYGIPAGPDETHIPLREFNGLPELPEIFFE